MKRHALAGTALCLALTLAGCGSSAKEETTTTTSTTSTTAAPVAEPKQLDIPKLGVHSSLVPLGLNSDGTHEVPPLDHPEQAGWYDQGPKPGENGPAILLGHINGKGKPGVFQHLGQLKSADTVLVDGVSYIVYDVLVVDKDHFPANRVYGNTTKPELRLITCGGAFDRASGNYLSNIIAFARKKI